MGRLLSARVHSQKTSTARRTRGRLPVGIGATAVLALLFATSAAAEPFRVTSGSFAFRWEGSVPVEVSGPDFRVTNADTNPEDFGLPGLAMEHADPSAMALPVSGHIQLNLSARLILTGDTEPAEGGDVLFDLLFSGPPGISHATGESCSGCAAIVATAPFRMTGVLTASGFDDPAGVFRHEIVGSGTATVGFFREVGTDTLRPFATYDFAPAAATPEPGTLMLLASGAGWFIRRKSRAG